MDDVIGHKWDYLAPQFVDFSKPLDDDYEEGDPEEYFNFDHENNIPLNMPDNEVAEEVATSAKDLVMVELHPCTDTKTPSSALEETIYDVQSSMPGLSMPSIQLELSKPISLISEEEKGSSETEANSTADETQSDGDVVSSLPSLKMTSIQLGLSINKPTSQESEEEKGSTEANSTSDETQSDSDVLSSLPSLKMTSIQIGLSINKPTSLESEEDKDPSVTEANSTAEEAMSDGDALSCMPSFRIPSIHLGLSEPTSVVSELTPLTTECPSPPQIVETIIEEEEREEKENEELDEDEKELNHTYEKEQMETAVEELHQGADVECLDADVNPIVAQSDADTNERPEALHTSIPPPPPAFCDDNILVVRPETIQQQEEGQQDEPVVTAEALVVQLPEVKPNAEPSQPKKPNNLVTSWNTVTKPSSPAPRMRKRSVPASELDRSLVTRSMSKPRRSTRLNHRRSHVPERLHIKQATPSKRRRTDLNISQIPQSANPRLTMPHTPSFMKRKEHLPCIKVKNTEQKQLETIQDFKQKMAMTRQMAKDSYRKVQVSSNYVPVRSELPVTRPRGFEFLTENRIAKNGPAPDQQDGVEIDFYSNLRKHSSPHKQHRGPTIPQPFNFSDQHREVVPSLVESFRSMAEQVAAFQVQTPERFRTTKNGQQNKGPVQSKAVPKLTCPKTPALETRKRKRPSNVVSALEKEDKEVEEMKNYRFKANPVNPRVMSNINIGMKTILQKEPTKPIGFMLHTDKRIQDREAEHPKVVEEKIKFHARPVPVKILQERTGLPEMKRHVLTCPKSPAFALKNRKQNSEDLAKQELEKLEKEKLEKERLIRKARPVPHTGVPFLPNLEHRTTELKPFSFASRDKATIVKKEQRIQEQYEDEQKLRDFKAQLMPMFDNISGIPEKKLKKNTEMKPFHFSQEDTGAKRANDWSKKMAEELEAERNQTFHAKQAYVLYKKPFIPQKSDKPLTEIDGFMMNSDKRAEQRYQYEMQKKMREEELNLERENLERANLLHEQKEVSQLRAAMVHKSNPIRLYKGVDIEPSDRPLTAPITPKFSDRTRSRVLNKQ